MSDHTSELESRDELLTRLSAPHGRSQKDREYSMAFLLVQLWKDMEVSRRFRENAISRLKNLKGIDKIQGYKNVMRDLNDDLFAMHLLESGCSAILDLTKNKDLAIAAEKRFSVAEAEEDHLFWLPKFGGVMKGKETEYAAGVVVLRSIWCKARRRYRSRRWLLFNLSLSFDNCDLFLFGFVIWRVMIRNSMNRGVTVLDRRRALLQRVSVRYFKKACCEGSSFSAVARCLFEIILRAFFRNSYFQTIPTRGWTIRLLLVTQAISTITLRQNCCRQNKKSAKRMAGAFWLANPSEKLKSRQNKPKYCHFFDQFTPLNQYIHSGEKCFQIFNININDVCIKMSLQNTNKTPLGKIHSQILPKKKKLCTHIGISIQPIIHPVHSMKTINWDAIHRTLHVMASSLNLKTGKIKER